MFFVSEEFLRKYEQGEDFVQTIDEVVAPGQGLFDQDYKSKADSRENRQSEKGESQ